MLLLNSVAGCITDNTDYRQGNLRYDTLDINLAAACTFDCVFCDCRELDARHDLTHRGALRPRRSGGGRDAAQKRAAQKRLDCFRGMSADTGSSTTCQPLDNLTWLLPAVMERIR